MTDAELKKKVQEIIDKELNPALGSHGGSVELVDVKAGKVYVKLGGGCIGCAHAQMTLRQGIEGTLKARIPEVKGVVDAAGPMPGGGCCG